MTTAAAARVRVAATVLLAVAAVALLAAWAWDLEMDLLRMLQEARATPGLLLASASVYAVVLALPFMPGMELGLLMMMVFGPPGVIGAYLATLAGLNCAFAAGVLARRHVIGGSRLKYWRDRATHWDETGDGTVATGWVRRLIEACHRRGGLADYLVIALLFNLPGNIVLGGGGGIALLAALSGRFKWTGFALTVALATCLLPALAWLGVIDLERWLLALG